MAQLYNLDDILNLANDASLANDALAKELNLTTLIFSKNIVIPDKSLFDFQISDYSHIFITGKQIYEPKSVHPIEIYLYDLSKNTINDFIEKLINSINPSSITFLKNKITFTKKYIYEIYLLLSDNIKDIFYLLPPGTPSIGYDGTNVILTESARNAIITGNNIYNDDHAEVLKYHLINYGYGIVLPECNKTFSTKMIDEFNVAENAHYQNLSFCYTKIVDNKIHIKNFYNKIVPQLQFRNYIYWILNDISNLHITLPSYKQTIPLSSVFSKKSIEESYNLLFEKILNKEFFPTEMAENHIKIISIEELFKYRNNKEKITIIINKQLKEVFKILNTNYDVNWIY